nr:T6SS effector BTH_I2691 family protein [uncultured Halomonas sp.]
MADSNSQRHARDAEFDETPTEGAVCPLNLKVAIFPVRYAIDESSSTAGTPQGPHPLVDTWQGPDYPTLATRSYTLRQLRDGWLYVCATFHEYRIDGHQFTRIPWPQDALAKAPDERTGGSGGKPYLLYPCQSQLSIAYSPFQWTWRICEHLRSNASARTRFMRAVDPAQAMTTPSPDFCFSHGAHLSELGKHVADITPEGATGDFTSTTTFTRALTEAERHPPSSAPQDSASRYEALGHKPEIDQSTILGQVPNKDEAIFIALDDPLGIVNDLTMNLLGREMEREQFEDAHGHRLNTALMVQRLAGVDIEALLPASVRRDPDQYAQATLKCYEYLEALSDVAGAESIGDDLTLLRLKKELASMGVAEPSRDTHKSQWEDKEHPRLDVEFEAAIAFACRKQVELERLDAQVARSSEDLTTWLERLPRSAQELCVDGCHPGQTQALLEFAAMVTQALGATQAGQRWLTATARQRDSLIGLALFNFSPALAKALDTLSRHFLETGSVARQADERPGLGDASNVASRANELNAVLALEDVQNSAVYQALAPPVQQFFDSLVEAVRGPARLAWEGIAYQLLPAVGAGATVTTQTLARSLSQTLLSAFVHPDNRQAGTRLVRQGDFERRHRRWRGDIIRHQNRLSGLQAALERPAAPHDRAAQLRQLNQQQATLEALATREPQRITARQSSGANARLVETLGFEEVREQQRLRLQQGAAAARQRLQGWMRRHGGGLPILVAGLNLINLAMTVDTITREGMDDKARQTLISHLGYSTSAVMALWVMPYWQKHATQTASLYGENTQLAKAGVAQWSGAGAAGKGFARIAARLTTAVAGMAAFGAIGAGMETWQIIQQHGRATSEAERSALFAKGASTGAMSLLAGAQVIGATRGLFFSFSWIMSSWIVWPLAIAGIVYLVSSWLDERYHRESIRLWLYHSSWGRAPKWPQNDQGQADEWRALMATFYRPSVRLTPVTQVTSERPANWSPGPMTRTHKGFWLKIALPAALGGETVQLSSNALRGFWAPAGSFAESSNPNASAQSLPASTDYAEGDMRVWQAWLPAREQSPTAPFTLTIDYADTLLDSPDGGADYVFHKPQANVGKYAIEPHNNRALRSLAPKSFALTVPTTPEPSAATNTTSGVNDTHEING